MPLRKLSGKKAVRSDKCGSGAGGEDDLGARLLGYSVIAGAALLGGQQADAGIVYSGPLTTGFGSVGGARSITMEGGAAEMTLSSSGGVGLTVTRAGNNFNVFNKSPGGTTLVKALLPVSSVSGGLTGVTAKTSGYFWNGASGDWDVNDEINFFGFSFEKELGGTTLYGWAQVQRKSTTAGILLGYAYEDTGGAIEVGTTPVPEPSTLALYALGAAGVAACRRRRRQQKKAGVR